MSTSPSHHLIENWDPEENWDSGIAWRTLTISTFSMIIAFCVWFLVSAIAPKLNAIGFHLTKSQLYWLTAMPGSRGFIRLVYMFLPPVIGTRRLVGYSSLLYLIPMLGWFFRRPEHVDRVRHPSPPRLPMRRWGRFFLRLHAINGLLLP
ncbi:nitrate/nitrite transporter [Cutibacterium acnes JCM 18918]|nr:nitrate/nitrite transporter [Cutibacterium acnes JCM 18918]